MLNRYKVRKHFVCEISDSGFDYRRAQQLIASEAELDMQSSTEQHRAMELLKGIGP